MSSPPLSLSAAVLRELEDLGHVSAAKVLRPLLEALEAAIKVKREKFHRTLPLGDYLVDRWDKARHLGFGARTTVYDSCLVLGDVKVGADCWIGPFTVLDGSGGLTIGDRCTISAGAHVYTHDTVQQTLSDAPIERSPVKIGNRVYVGPNVVIARGVTIGDSVVIGANSFVNADLPSHARAAGSPARILGQSK